MSMSVTQCRFFSSKCTTCITAQEYDRYVAVSKAVSPSPWNQSWRSAATIQKGNTRASRCHIEHRGRVWGCAKHEIWWGFALLAWVVPGSRCVSSTAEMSSDVRAHEMNARNVGMFLFHCLPDKPW